MSLLETQTQEAANLRHVNTLSKGSLWTQFSRSCVSTRSLFTSILGLFWRECPSQSLAVDRIIIPALVCRVLDLFYLYTRSLLTFMHTSETWMPKSKSPYGPNSRARVSLGHRCSSFSSTWPCTTAARFLIFLCPFFHLLMELLQFVALYHGG